MSLTSLLLSATVGRIAPRYRTLGQWSKVYCKIIEGRPIADKTKDNRRCSLAHMLTRLGGGRTISTIRPHEIASMVMGIHKSHPPLAKRVLIETKDVFQQAVDYGWLDRSPAMAVKAPLVKVQRQRLSFEQWQAIHAYAVEHMPPWVSRMMVLALVSGQRRSDIAKMRFDDVWDGLLHIEQEKTGARLALPLEFAA